MSSIIHHKSTVKAVITTVICILLMSAFPWNAQAQEHHNMLHRLDSLLSIRYMRADIDTHYIMRPPTKWTIRGRLNVSGAKIMAEGVNDGRRLASELKADYKKTLSMGVSYMGIALNFALNPAKLLGRYNDYELNINSYGKRFGFDVIYQNAHNFTGWEDVQGQERIELPANLLKLQTLNINAFHTFNHRRFSYPAAFTQSYIQRRSAGSLLLALSAQGQKGTLKYNYQSFFKMTNIGIGAGYGYNYVPAPGWLFHLSALPTFIVYSKTSLTVDDNHIPLRYHFPEVIITGRGAIVHQRGNIFYGISGVFNFTNIGDENSLTVRNTKWRSRAFLGFRL